MIVNEYQNNNASIKVHWEDTVDNYSEVRERDIEKYFKNKYNTEKVSVIFKAILSKESGIEVEGNVDASEMVLDENYQKTLIEKYLADNGITINQAFLDKLDSTVNTHLEDYKDNTSRYKKVNIKNLWFDNFLSYGNGNKIPVEGRRGITSVLSDPANYGGKTTATIDVMLFLFFGDTTKSEKNADIFNRFTGENVVTVGGEIEIEGETYVIERTLTRTATKAGEYKVVSSVEFKKRLPRGGYKSLKGDEKKMTEEIIKTYVGTQDDFLITILSTGKNLDDLLETKPTERGRILTRFIGLEYFREKEKIAKGLYDEWKKTSKLHKVSMGDINTQVENFNTVIQDTEMMKLSVDANLNETKAALSKLIEKRDLLLGQRIPVDTELYKVNEEDIIIGLNALQNKIVACKQTYEVAIKDMIKPDNIFDVDRLAILEAKCQADKGAKMEAELNIKNLEFTNKQLKDSENCPSCKRPLVGVDYTTQIEENKKNIENIVAKISNLTEEISISLTEIEEIKLTKTLWDEYNRKELMVNKIKFELEQYEGSYTRGAEKLQKYREAKENVEKNRLIDTDLNVLKIKLAEVEEQKEGYMLQSKGYEKDVENARMRILEYGLVITEVAKEEIIDKIYRTYLDIYGKNGISKMVLSTMMPLINHHLKTLLSESSEFDLEMRMNDKNEVDFWMVDKVSGVLKPSTAGSGFEKTLSSLALRCVLSKVCSLPKPNIIIFDEVFSRVANENLDKIGLFFEKIRDYFEHIWLISHNPLISEWSDHSIKVRKTNNISEIITE